LAGPSFTSPIQTLEVLARTHAKENQYDAASHEITRASILSPEIVIKLNSLGKTTDSPNQNARSPRVSQVFLNPLMVILLGGAFAAGLVLVARNSFAHSKSDTFSRKFAELMLQLALIVVIGALINFFLKVYSDRRAARDQENNNRLELLRRMRAVHVAVAYAQGLIFADNSGQTYSEQLRKLMTLTYELEDIQEDVKMAKRRHLFRPLMI
jgi:hypothetical protein